jgi:pentatricopeptide repeat protein
MKGLYREALPEFQKHLDLNGSTIPLAYLGYCYARLGEHSQALRILEEMKARSHKEFVPAYAYAFLYAGLGEKDQAFASLTQAVEERDIQVTYLHVEPLWDSFRSDPRFAELVRKVGLPQ